MRTDAQLERYYWRHYKITLAEYNAILAAQGGCCYICGRRPFGRRLAVDHDHRIAKGKILFERAGRMWSALIRSGRVVAKLKSEVKKIARAQLLRASVRGIICWRCNRGLQFYRDIAATFDRASHYLRFPPARGVLSERLPKAA